MSRPPPFFDTNILLYSISGVPSEAAKRERAIALLEGEDGALSVQVLQEFYVQATRPTGRSRLPHELAVAFVQKWTRFQLQEMTLTILNAALEITAAHRLSYWDSAIIAAAHALGCRELYTEDMNDGQRIAGVLIVNPFR
jgi:predicted nucleic acid-binding protein